MNFNLSEEQQMLRDGAERFIRENHAFSARQSEAGPVPVEPAHWKSYAEFGWLGLGLPEDVGGMAVSFVETAIVTEELGRGLVVSPFVPTAVLCARILDRCGSEPVRRELLPAIVEGRARVALAHSEDGARFDLANVSATRAVRGAAGGYTMNGVKTVALHAPSASWLIVSAALEAGGFGFFLVDANAAGVTRRDYPLIDRSQASDIELRNVAVGENALLASGDHAFALLEEAMDRAVLATVAEMLGVMEKAVSLTTEHVKTRVQFGQPLGKFQAVQHMMADSFIELQETRSILYRGIAFLDSDRITRAVAVSAAKAYAGPAGKQVGANCVQLHGGIGITEECQVGHCYRKLVLLEKVFGDTEHHLSRVAALRLGPSGH